MNVLIVCEESQVVTKAFRELGHNAFSCDIKDCSGGHPEWHIKGDCLRYIDGFCFFCTCDYKAHFEVFNSKWDLIIAHPPCTYLCVTGNGWFNIQKYGSKAIDRYNSRYKAIVFFTNISRANCERIAIENPVGIMSTAWRKPDQYIQPYWFGDPFEKKTGLWLKNLPKLKPTNKLNRPERVVFSSGKSMPKWYADLWSNNNRDELRSKTFPGIACAMADQWGCLSDTLIANNK